MNINIELLATTSRFAIAAAIFYFAYQLAQINSNAPTISESVDQISRHIEPTLAEAKNIRAEIAEVRKLVPDILTEVAEVRKQIPLVVAEIENVRAQIPPMLTQVDAINQQIGPILQRIDNTVAVVDDTQKQIPRILDSTDKAVVALNQTREQITPLVSQTLEQVKLTREKIDPTLDRVDDLVEDAYAKATSAISAAEDAGKEASEGAVKGFFTGLIKLPFELVGTLASPLVKSIDKGVAKQLTEKDIELMADLGNQVKKSAKLNQELHWKNPQSGNSGSLTPIRKYQLKGSECVEIKVRISNKRKEIMKKINNYCLDQQDKWVLARDIEQ